MTFPDNMIRQLGFMTGIGALAGFLLEIPSGYFADRFGHKKTLIPAKIFLTSIFFAITFGIYMSVNGFRGIYLESVGLPVIFIGFVMGLSRLVWRGLSKITHIVEDRISINKLMFFEIFLYSISLLSIGLIKAPYIVGIIFALVSGYQWARVPIIDNFILKNLKDKQYKATILSMRSQISAIISFSLMFILGFIMEFSYTRGFLTVALLAFIGLSSMFVLARRSNNNI